MSRTDHDAALALIAPWRAALVDANEGGAPAALAAACAQDVHFHWCHPIGSHVGADAAQGAIWDPLLAAVPDLERRDTILVPGRDAHGIQWVGACGYYTGTFANPWLDIPATRRQVAVRFHEFFRIEEGRVAEVQAVWDIPHVMMQAGVWPMGPGLGREWHVPGPATQDGLHRPAAAAEQSTASLKRINAMLADMGLHPAEPVEAMRLETHWHPSFSWYGPSGIGTQRGVAGFRHGHQIPFLAALPDRRGGYRGEGHFWADGPYVAVTGWPNMAMTVTGGGWLGIAPTGAQITMRSLDFWRVEKDRIRENWVLIDLLDVWAQLDVDVLARMRELVRGPALT